MATDAQINERATNLSFKKLSGYQYTSPSSASFEEQGAAPFKLHAKHVWTTDIPASPIFAMADRLVPGYKSPNFTFPGSSTQFNYETNPTALEDELRARFSNPNDYAESAWTDNFSFRRKKFELTRVTTTKQAAVAWLIGRFNSNTNQYELGEVIDDKFIETNGYIGTQFGTGYAAQVFIGNQEVPTGVEWNFDYDTGILTFLSTTGLKDPNGANITLNAASRVYVTCYKYIGQLGTESAGEPYDDVLGNFIIEPNANYTRKTNQIISTIQHINTFEAGA